MVQMPRSKLYFKSGNVCRSALGNGSPARFSSKERVFQSFFCAASKSTKTECFSSDERVSHWAAILESGIVDCFEDAAGDDDDSTTCAGLAVVVRQRTAVLLIARGALSAAVALVACIVGEGERGI